MLSEQRNTADEPRITAELNLWSSGDFAALNRAFPRLYAELEKLAQAKLRSFPGYQTLDASAVLHELYFRLQNTGKRGFATRGHFFALASCIMRGILVDHARKSDLLNQGERSQDVRLTFMGEPDPPVDVVAVHEALSRLATVDPVCAKIVEMKFFGGFTTDEIAQSLEMSPITVKRRWTRAQAWLREHLEPNRPVAPCAEPLAPTH
jgi:RNA polymerase sigma factor (TIGR02999 family)